MDKEVSVLRRAKALPPVAVGADARERRLHMRAHRYWLSLPHAGAAPLWQDFDPLRIDDRCTQSFMLRLSADGRAARARLIGQALRDEGGVAEDEIDVADAPEGSLLVRLSTHLPELLMRAVPLSVEAPFRTQDGRPGHYRGMLMPFTSCGRTIDIAFGVVSWRELSPIADNESAPEPGPGADVISLF
jgi:hypothetical protein